MNTYYHSFSHYKQELPKTNYLVFVGMNNNKLITKGFLTSNVCNFYIIDKTKEHLGDKSLQIKIPDTFIPKWHFDKYVKIFDENNLFKVIYADSINVFYRESTKEYIIQLGVKKKNRKEA